MWFFSTGSCHQVGLPLGQDQGLKLVRTRVSTWVKLVRTRIGSSTPLLSSSLSFPTRVLDLSVMEMELLINSNPRIDINDLDGLNNDKLMHFYFVGIQSFKTDLTPWNDMTYCLTSGFPFTYYRNNLLVQYSKKNLTKLLRNYIMPYFTRLTWSLSLR